MLKPPLPPIKPTNMITDPKQPVIANKVIGSKHLRPLKWNELVKRGDFVDDGLQGFEPWVGPAGFRADMFVKQIYRRLGNRPAAVTKATT